MTKSQTLRLVFRAFMGQQKWSDGICLRAVEGDAKKGFRSERSESCVDQPIKPKLKFHAVAFRAQLNSKWRRSRMVQTNSSNSLRFLRVRMEAMSIEVICAVVKEEFRMS